MVLCFNYYELTVLLQHSYLRLVMAERDLIYFPFFGRRVSLSETLRSGATPGEGVLFLA